MKVLLPKHRTPFLAILQVLLAASLFYGVCAVSFLLPVDVSATVLGIAESEPIVILDAGHGGEDCGAIGTNGIYEKDVNFAISTTLAAMLRSAGITVIETRTEDRLLYREEENIKGYRKIYDLRNRLAVAEANPEALFVSIHMNSFPEEQYSGFQVYYSRNTENARILAEKLQRFVTDRLQPNNTRKIKPAGDTIYLLDRAENTAVLLECGFLSNSAECEKLSNEDYQKELSFVLFCGIMEYIEEYSSDL